jgi:hypothetical protein
MAGLVVEEEVEEAVIRRGGYELRAEIHKEKVRTIKICTNLFYSKN